MPRVLGGGAWGAGSLPVGKANIWMSDLLVSLGCPPAPAQSIGTHSCKATLLSWCAKFGLPVADRRLLGYHTKPKDLSVLEYSRDAQAGPLRRLHEVLSSIRERIFSPMPRDREGGSVRPRLPRRSRAVAALGPTSGR